MTRFLIRFRSIDQTDIGFMDQGRGLKRVARSLVAQIAAGQPAQFCVYERHRLVDRRLIPLTASPKQFTDGRRFCRHLPFILGLRGHKVNRRG
jgi:hypothetical protein